MSLMIQPLYHCPFCSAQRGLIAVDLRAFSVFTVSPPPPPVVGAPLPDFLLFSPGVTSRPVCRHTVKFMICGTLVPAFQSPATGAGPEFGAHWNDPWFAVNDPEGAMRNVLSMVMAHPERELFRPATPHRIDQVKRCWRLPCARWQLQVVGRFVAALEPEAFLAELAGPDIRMAATVRSW